MDKLTFLNNHVKTTAMVFRGQDGRAQGKMSLNCVSLTQREAELILNALGDEFDEMQEIYAKHMAGTSVKKLAYEYGDSIKSTKDRLVSWERRIKHMESLVVANFRPHHEIESSAGRISLSLRP